MDKLFDPQKIVNFHSVIKSLFTDYFTRLDYKEHKPSLLIPSDDHSVQFTGSTSNTFKSYIVHSSLISRNGFFLIQKCLRTQNAKLFWDDNTPLQWASYFTEVGLITKADNVKNLIVDTVNYLVNVLEIERERLHLKVSSQDSDLLSYARKTSLEIDIDNMAIENYRHRYGLPEVIGRNINFGIKNNKTNVIKNVGTIVLVEKQREPIVAEMGFGISTLLAGYYDLSNSIEASSISTIVPFKSGLNSKFADALSASVVMIKEGVYPSGRGRGRILRTYLYAVKSLSRRIGLSMDDILRFTEYYEELEYGKTSFIADDMLDLLEG